MLTIRVDALSLEFFRTKPDSDTMMKAILTEESFDIWDETPERKGIRLVNEAVQRATGASLAEILGLVDLLNEYESAITYDCLSIGMRLIQLGTQKFTWGELLAIVQHSPHISALNRAMNPDEWMWDTTNHLLADIDDQLHVANWQRGSGKKKDFPKPIKRPGIVTDEVTKYGKDAIPYDEMAAFLGGDFINL